MDNFTISTLNVNGIKNSTKRNSIFVDLSCSPTDLILLQDTHSSPDLETHFIDEWTHGQSIFHSPPPTTSVGGVAIIVNAPNLYLSNIMSDNEGRILAVDVSCVNFAIRVINIYAPSSPIPYNKLHIFFNNLYPYFSTKLPNILAGDFNFVENPQIDCYPPQPKRHSFSTFSQLINTFNLCDALRTLTPNDQIFTRRSQHSQSRLDRFYISSTLTPTAHMSTPNSYSDHDRVTIKVNLKIPRPFGKPYWKNNISHFKNDDLKQNLTSLILARTMALQSQNLNPLQLWLNLKASIKHYLVSYAQQQSIKEKEEIIILQTQLIQLQNMLHTQPTDALFTQFYNLKQRLHQISLTNARIHLLKSKQYLPEYNTMPNPLLYKELLPKMNNNYIYELYDEYSLPYNDKENLLHITKEYYQNLYGHFITPEKNMKPFLNAQINTLTSENTTALGEEINQKELLTSIKSFKYGKTPGLDGLSAEFYIEFWKAIRTPLTNALNYAYTTGNTTHAFTKCHYPNLQKRRSIYYK